MSGDLIEYLATGHEAALAEDIEEIGFGELYGVQSSGDDGEKKRITITPKTRHFFLMLRRVGTATKVIIHDGEPTVMEFRMDAPASGYRCLKKYKL